MELTVERWDYFNTS